MKTYNRMSYWTMGLIYGLIVYIIGVIVLSIVSGDVSLRVLFWTGVQTVIASLLFVFFMMFFAKNVIRKREEQNLIDKQSKQDK